MSLTSSAKLLYITDLEGNGDRLVNWVKETPELSWDSGGNLSITDSETRVVFGGDSIDRGPKSRWILKTLLQFKKKYPSRVTLLAGNREINKLRIPFECKNADDLKKFFNKVNATKAFDFYRQEVGKNKTDQEIFKSYLADLNKGGVLRDYLNNSEIIYRWRDVLFVHGGLTEKSYGVVPDLDKKFEDLDKWISEMNLWYLTELRRGEINPEAMKFSALMAYHFDSNGVIYARFSDSNGNPSLPPESLIKKLHSSGVKRVAVGHTPQDPGVTWLIHPLLSILLGDVSSEHGNTWITFLENGTVRVKTELKEPYKKTIIQDFDPAHPSRIGQRIPSLNGIIVGKTADQDLWVVKIKTQSGFGFSLKEMTTLELNSVISN